MATAEIQTNPEIADAHAVIEASRERITDIDSRIAGLLVERQMTVHAIALERRVAGAPVYNGEQQRQTITGFIEAADEQGVERETAKKIIHPLVATENRVSVTHAEIAVYEGEDTTEVIAEGLRRKTEIDQELVELIAKRQAVAAAIGEAKKVLGISIYNETRELHVITGFVDAAAEGGVPRALSHGIITDLIQASRGIQSVLLARGEADGGELILTEAAAQ